MPSCYAGATCWGEALEKRGITAQRGRGCHPWLCSWDAEEQRVNDTSSEQCYKDLSEGGSTENPELPVLKEKLHCASVE